MRKGSVLEKSSEADRDLWEEYGRTRLPEVRLRLVNLHLEMTHRIAAALYARRINDTVAFDDYLQYGRVGLLEAVDRYDSAREASFATFASYRIRGAILNGLERATESAAQAAHKRRARQRERAQSLALDVESRPEASPDSFEGMVDMAVMLAMGYVLEDNGQWNPSGANVAGDPYRSVHLERVRARLSLLVDALPERERLIVQSHYFEHMEFRAIAEMLEVTKGRVSQLHARALQLIREGYEDLEGVDVEL
jgi:RNA polymerase sigma factor for flagellar operon FliA